MEALCLTDEGLRLVENFPTPCVAPGEAVIAVSMAGICATDLQLLAGYKGGYRGVLGHEFVGHVVAVEATRAEWLGKRVVGELNIGCGECALCRRGLGKHCGQRQSLGIINRNGAFAMYTMLPLDNLHVVPELVSDRSAVFTEPLASALEILEQVRIDPDTNVVVIGDGRLGQLIARTICLTGCNLTIVGKHEDKLARLRESGISATVLCPPPEERTESGLRDEWFGAPVDVVIEATGHADGFVCAREIVRPGGTVVLKSTFADGKTPVDLSGLVVDEVTVVGSRCGPFVPALRLLEKGLVEVESLIVAEFPLAESEAAFEYAARRGVLKVLLNI